MPATQSPTITLRLPWPPSANKYRICARGRWFLSAKGQQYHCDVEAIVADELGVPCVPLSGRLGVSIEAVMPDRRRRDLDNMQKIILDSLQACRVFENDFQIDDLRIKRLHVEPPGCVDVCIQELTAAGE